MSQVRVRDNDADVDDGNGFGVSSNDHSGRDQIRGDSVVTNGTIRGGARRSRWPTTTSRVHGSQGIHHAGGAKIIELTPYRERYRNRVLAEVGLGDDEDGDDGACSDDVVVGREQHEKDRRRKKQKKQSVLKHKDSSAESSDDAEFDDILHDDNDLEYESFRHSDGDNAHTWHADSATRITVKLLWIALAVAAFIFIFREDDEFINEPEEDVEKNKVPYSYKGYKDARIPDDDIAQYGGGVLGGEALGIDSENYKTIVDDGESDIKDDESEQSQITQQQSHHEPTGIVEIDALWEQLDGYSDMSVPYDAQRDLPVFWHVPKSGGTTLQDLLMHCVGMVGANEIGAAHSQETGHLEIVHTEDGNRYVNVDMSNPSGIAHAAELGFGSSGLADVVITSWLDQAASVFDSDHKGRWVFTLFPSPLYYSPMHVFHTIMISIDSLFSSKMLHTIEASNTESRFLVLLPEGCHLGAYLQRSLQKHDD